MCVCVGVCECDMKRQTKHISTLKSIPTSLLLDRPFFFLFYGIIPMREPSEPGNFGALRYLLIQTTQDMGAYLPLFSPYP